MKALPKQARARQKRMALIEAAIQEFSMSGFEVATAKTIAAKAGVATGTFYQYFENKNDILRVIAHERYSALQTHIEWFEVKTADLKTGDESMILDTVFRRVLQSIYEFHISNPQLHQILEHRKTQDQQLAKIMYEGEQVLFAHIFKFVQSFNVSHADVIANNLFAMGEGIVHRLVFESDNADAEKVLDIGAQMLVSYFKSM